MAGSKPEIGAKIVLDGAEEYQRSLKEVANAQKDLNKEMKLAESEFKKTGNAQQLYNEKVRLLNAQMDNQKKKLETAQKALKELSDKGVDKNSDLWRKWNGILLDSQTKMNNLQAELNSTTAAMKDTADATEQAAEATERATQETADYSETLKSIDKGVKFGNILNGLRTVKDAVGGVISTAFRMGKALVMSQISGGDWAREIMMGAAAADLSVEEYQARQYAQALSGIEYGPIDESIQELRKRLNSTGEDAVAVFKTMNELGLASRETELQAMDAAKAFWEIANVLDEIENKDTRNTLAERLFGDKYMQLRGFLNYGSEEYLKLIEEGREAATVTEESVKALADMDAAVEKVNSTSETLKHNVQSQLAPGFTEVANAFSSMIQDLNEFIQSDEGQEVFNKWNEALTGIATSISETDFSNLFTKAANAASAITDALQWLTKNGENVKYWLMAIGGAFATIQISSDVLMFLTLVKSAKELFGGKAASSVQMGAGIPLKSILDDVKEDLNIEIPLNPLTFDKDGNLIELKELPVSAAGISTTAFNLGPKLYQDAVSINTMRRMTRDLQEVVDQAWQKALETAMSARVPDELIDILVEKYAGSKKTDTRSEIQKVLDNMADAYTAEDMKAFADGLEKIFANKEKYGADKWDPDALWLASFVKEDLQRGLRPSDEQLMNVLEMLYAEAFPKNPPANSGGSAGSRAMQEFNEALAQEGKKTKPVIEESISNAFSGLESAFASMGAAHGAAYINALSAQISRINSMLMLGPVYSQAFNAAQSAFAAQNRSGNGMFNASFYVGEQKFGQFTAPLVNGVLGLELMSQR